MKFQYFLLVFLLFFYNTSSAQNTQHFNFGIESNSQYYVDDVVTGDFTQADNFRSNNYLKADYSINNFSFGLQLEGYAPQALLSYSPKYDNEFNIGTYYANFKNEKWDVTLGYFYEQIGSGLLLRSWEDRQLGINNSIRGTRIKLQISDKVSFTTFYGKQRVGFDISNGSIFGFDSNFDISSFVTSDDISLALGLSYVGRHQETNPDNGSLNPITNGISSRVDFSKGNFYSSIEGVLKSKDALVEDNIVYADKLFYGNALLFNLGFSKKGFGINSTFRRLENMTFFSDREASGNTYNEQIINYLPGLTKQHDYALTNIYVYQAQPGLTFSPLQKAGEIGGQIDFYYKIKKGSKLGGKYGTKLAANFSSWYGLGAQFNSEYKRVEVGFLKFGEKYFTDFNIEIRKKLSKKVSGILTYVNSFYNKKYIEEAVGEVHSNVLIAESTIKFTRKKSIRIEGQHLWTKADKKNWAAGTAELNLNTHLSFFVTDMYNYGNDDVTHQDHFYNFGGSYTKNKSRIALSYGRQRGGLLCVGGVCREVPAATGLTLNLTSSF